MKLKAIQIQQKNLESAQVSKRPSKTIYFAVSPRPRCQTAQDGQRNRGNDRAAVTQGHPAPVSACQGFFQVLKSELKKIRSINVVIFICKDNFCLLVNKE